MKEGIWIGTSGWSYKGWAETFYPKDWPKKDHLGFYFTQFPTVEINATFYRLPSEDMTRGWHERAPDDFTFAVKGSRFITHMKRLKDVENGLKKYFDRIRPLGKHTGPILWQLPPNFGKDIERLKAFLKLLPKRYCHAVEFRHKSWIDDETFDLLRRHNAAQVWLSSMAMPMDFTVTADFVYVRFHGLKKGAAHDYTEAELKPWARELSRCARAGTPAFVYFNNDLNTRAPLNAKMLMKMTGRAAVQPKSFLEENERPKRRAAKRELVAA